MNYLYICKYCYVVKISLYIKKNMNTFMSDFIVNEKFF